MTTEREYRLRHTDVKYRLKFMAVQNINKGEILIACKKIAKKLKKSPQTVYNYINGDVKDGYLADAILKELHALKPVPTKTIN